MTPLGDDRLAAFICLSALLTGFDGVELNGTGVACDYLGALDTLVPTDIVGDLLDAHATIAGHPERADDLVAALLADARLGPVARNLMALWFSGSWAVLPPEWTAAFGGTSADTPRLLSGAAYRAGLQWRVAAAHPPGAGQQGYGAWALPPEPVS